MIILRAPIRAGWCAGSMRSQRGAYIDSGRMAPQPWPSSRTGLKATFCDRLPSGAKHIWGFPIFCIVFKNNYDRPYSWHNELAVMSRGPHDALRGVLAGRRDVASGRMAPQPQSSPRNGSQSRSATGRGPRRSKLQVGNTTTDRRKMGPYDSK